MSSKASRVRAPNISKEDQLLLFSAIEPYIKIVECKKTDSIKLIDKLNAWKKIAEVFNANTKGVQRTVENLKACYHDAKSKIKKQHSEAKMLLDDPSKKEALINAIEENGTDWQLVASSINTPVDVCLNTFEEIEREVKKNEILHKRDVLGTGGGPPSSNEDPYEKIKNFIEPQIDGMYTIYDGDADLLDQFQKTKKIEDQVDPIEMEFIDYNKENLTPQPSTSEQNSCKYKSPVKTEVSETPSRVDFLRKKRALELQNSTYNFIFYKYTLPIQPLYYYYIQITKILFNSTVQSILFQILKLIICLSQLGKKRKNVNESFLSLSLQKQELVNLQKKLILMEIDHKAEMNALEKEEKENEMKFKKLLYEKELYLKDLKIKKI